MVPSFAVLASFAFVYFQTFDDPVCANLTPINDVVLLSTSHPVSKLPVGLSSSNVIPT